MASVFCESNLGKFLKLQQLLFTNYCALVDKVSGSSILMIPRIIEGRVSLHNMHLEGSAMLKELSMRNCSEMARLWRDKTSKIEDR